jgi:prepilin-type N-terminal cleavage/methylation domain-containing protein
MIATHTGIRMRRSAGFTLVEILVVIMLLAMVASMAIPLIRGDTPQQQMEASTQRLASLMAMCRAQAMLNGHPVRLTWEAGRDDPKEPLLPVVTHEADPIGSPGAYKRMAASWANDPILQKNVQIRLVQAGAFDLSSLAKTQGRFDLPVDPSVQMVEFRPDGTADAAVFVLTTKLPEGSSQDELQGWVVLDTVSGLAHVRKPPTAEQFDGLIKAQAALPDLQFQEKAVEVAESDASGVEALLGKAGMTTDDLTDIMAASGSSPRGGSDKAPGTPGDESAPGPGGNTGNNNSPGNSIDMAEMARLADSGDKAAIDEYIRTHGGDSASGNNTNTNPGGGTGGGGRGGNNNAGAGNNGGGRGANNPGGNNGGRNRGGTNRGSGSSQ